MSLERKEQPSSEFQMYWTKKTAQKYSDQSQHQRRFT